MKEVFIQTDKYKDEIIKRTDFIQALKENKNIKTFLNEEAIRIDKNKLTLDEVLREFEKDQFEVDDDQPKGAFNHKEYFSWDEFVDFLENYQIPEHRRMKKLDQSKRSRTIIVPGADNRTLTNKEKEELK